LSYAIQHLNEAVEIIRKMDMVAIERMADLLAEVNIEAVGSFSRRRRQCRQLLACRQRFQENRRNRILCADGQCLRADGPHQ
jgi:hypothetical protein